MQNDTKIKRTMWELHNFINTWSESADEGICDAYTDSLIEAVIDIAEKLKKLYEEESEMKKFTLKDYKEFCKEALICPPFEDDEQIDEWLATHKVHIIANDCVMELEYNADTINEIEFSLKEIHEAILGDGTPTTGNTKVTSMSLLTKYLGQKYEQSVDSDATEDCSKIYRDFIRAAKDEWSLSDLVECLRIENDLRPSEVQIIYNDFGCGCLLGVVEKVIRNFLKARFEVNYSQDGDKTFLMFFGKYPVGEVINFLWGNNQLDDFSNDIEKIIDNLWNEILNRKDD